MSKSAIEWDVAEVLEYDYTYQYISPNQISSNVDKLFALKVRSCSEYFNNNIFIVKPSNINLKQIPLVGEFVGYYKFRVGDYRLICSKEDDKLVVIVVEIGHRREVYK